MSISSYTQLNQCRRLAKERLVNLLEGGIRSELGLSATGASVLPRLLYSVYVFECYQPRIARMIIKYLEGTGDAFWSSGWQFRLSTKTRGGRGGGRGPKLVSRFLLQLQVLLSCTE